MKYLVIVCLLLVGCGGGESDGDNTSNTEAITNPDGSITTTTVNDDGSSTTTDPDEATTVETVNEDGSTTDTTTDSEDVVDDSLPAMILDEGRLDQSVLG